jgi:SAM-dependent methyltransferase
VGRAPGLRRALRHGYLNRRFGLSLEGASPLGPVIVPLVPGLAARQRRWARLPRPYDRASLLDVGAGSGGTVAHFRKLGWEAKGIDTDPAAVAAARASDLPVSEGEITTFPGGERFAAITMGHSIEHLHEPAQALAAAFRLLKPAGILELITPNAGALGRRIYARDWLGLDPPRHLVVFTPRGLKLALRGAGFEKIAFTVPPVPRNGISVPARRYGGENRGRMGPNLGGQSTWRCCSPNTARGHCPSSEKNS